MDSIANIEDFADSVGSGVNGVFTESIHIHNKALFDAFNEALNTFRRFKNRAQPDGLAQNWPFINYSNSYVLFRCRYSRTASVEKPKRSYRRGFWKGNIKNEKLDYD